jgi:hypothetical protein
MPNRKRSLPATRRRALELLAGSRDGVPEALMLAHGFTVEMLVEMINAGLATASSERVIAGRHPTELTRRLWSIFKRGVVGTFQQGQS